MSLPSATNRSVTHPVRWEPRLYPGRLAYARTVRADIRRDLAGFPDDPVAAIELCGSEIFANAVVHTASGDHNGEVTRWLSLHPPGTLRLEVVDAGWAATVPNLPDYLTHPEALFAEGHRGLLLLASCARHWGYYCVLPHPQLNLGLGVWADFAVPPHAVPTGLERFIPTG